MSKNLPRSRPLAPDCRIVIRGREPTNPHTAMATLTPSTDPYVILCGAGASGTGLLVAASQHGYLHKLAKRGGIVAYEKNEHTGGMLANTRIPSNSFASVFIECLPGLRTTFGEDCKELQLLEESKQVKIIKEIGKAAMELTHVGEYLKKLGNTVWNLCSNICRAELHLKHEVRAIHMLPGGGVEVTAVSSDGIETKRRCTKVVISMGGVQNLDVIEHIPITSDGLTLAAFRDNMVPSHEVVQRTGTDVFSPSTCIWLVIVRTRLFSHCLTIFLLKYYLE